MARARFGSWSSPLSPAHVAAGRVSLTGPQVVGRTCWWSESRPAEGGRQVVMRAVAGATTEDAAPEEMSPPAVSVRSKVHEYGGGAYHAEGDTLFYTDMDDQALWRNEPRRGARRLTPPPPDGEEHRYADARLVAGGRWLVAVRERHCGARVDDEVVAVDANAGGAVVVLAGGRDFFASPRPSPDGRLLAWVTWDHPNMPWDGCELWVGALGATDDGRASIGDGRRVAGGPDESVGQPTWAPDGALWFVSDRHGWWQPHRLRPDGSGERMCDEEAEFHGPDWVLGQATMDFLDDGALVCRFRREGRDRVGVVDPGTGSLREVPQPYAAISGLQALGAAAVVVGATARQPPAIGLVDLAPSPSRVGRRGPPAPEAEGVTVLRRPVPPTLTADRVSPPEPEVFETAGGARAYLLFHSPGGGVVTGPAGELPPLVVLCHGGPTGTVDAAFDLGVQMWTTRGVAVALVDYRGSSGHGRAFRRLLDGMWGVADAEDCAAAAAHLAATGRVDGARMVVKGSSAGGFTALRALVPGGPFRAAVVAYPVTDLRALAADTHKFESRYLDRLVGPWPEAAARYEERSPALHPERIGGAVLLLQGEDDPVVPPDQAARLADALRARGVRCDHVVFPGESHGFRRADTLERCARLELEFVGEVLGFQPVT